MLDVPIHILPAACYTHDLTLLNFKVAVATHMIRPYSSRKRAVPDNNIGSKMTYQYKHEPTEVPNHLPEFQRNHHWCISCYAADINRKTFVKCSECGVFLSCQRKKLFVNISSKSNSFILINLFIVI